MKKFFLLLLLLLFCLPAGLLFAETDGFTRTMENVPMSDGTLLATDIYLPAGKKGPFPCVLIRTPYNKSAAHGDGERFAKKGYAVVIQDTRGKYGSQGRFYPFRHERRDGLETAAWIRSREWSNGKIAGWGGSYVGYTQWAIADQLDVIFPLVTSANMFELAYPGGLLSLATIFNWGLVVDSKTVNNIKPEKLSAACSILPLSVADDSTFAQNDFVDDWLAHTRYDGYWAALDHRAATAPPMISIAGWYDIFLEPQINDFIRLGAQRHPASRLIIGPYAHGKILIDTDFDDHARVSRFQQDEMDLMAAVFAGQEPSPVEKPFTLFVMHKNRWVDCATWPPENSRQTAYYFQPDGRLSTDKPEDARAFEYDYDPLDPYRSLGGSFLGNGVGPAIQNPNTSRTDQVVFESAALTEPLTLLGPVSAVVFAASNAPCTDFYVSLQEVQSDGTIINIQEGGAPFYGDDSAPVRAKKLEISLWATGIEIAAGKKLRVVVTSSLFPRYNRNLNSGEPIFSAQTPRVAHQTLFTGADMPSCILLPLFRDER